MKRPVDVIAALVLVLLLIGFLGFTNAIIPRFCSVQPEVQIEAHAPSPKIRVRHRAALQVPATDSQHRKAAKAVLVWMLGFAPGGG